MKDCIRALKFFADSRNVHPLSSQKKRSSEQLCFHFLELLVST